MVAVPDKFTPQLRPMLSEDIPHIMQIETTVYDFPWTEGIFHDCLNVGYCCWVYEADDKIIAYGLMSLGADEAHILNLCVHPRYQRCGFGRGILEHLISLAERYRADTVFLEVRPSNIPAVSLYESIGFSEVGFRRAYYPSHNGREDAMILAKEILRP